MRILLLAPTHREAAWFDKALRESGHSVQCVGDWRDGAHLACQEQFDAVIVMMFEPQTFSNLCDRLLTWKSLSVSAVRMVVLGWAATFRDRVVALRAGADVCLSHPYTFREIHEHLHALWRRVSHAKSCTALVTGQASDPLQPPASSQPVEAALRRVITRREALLFECLMRHSNTPVSREQLVRYIWQDTEDVDPSGINVVVSRLRRKLAEHMPHASIETISRYGYQLRFSFRQK
ncbi:response regulator transcription factor (plasmid) [Burkholderia pyrrocinia]|uniref:response regulator transcription factor n=1 Tax=Burkholderia pyrrocinia TaxID=60550 RepID=UPI0038B56138